MDNMRIEFILAPVMMLIIALIKKTGVASWLALGMCIGLMVVMSNPTHSQAMVWACCCNAILITAMKIHFNQSKNILPVVISVTLLIEVIISFFSLVAIHNGESILAISGWVTGAMTYAQIILVLSLDDKRGSIVYVLDDLRDMFSSAKRFIGVHKH